LSRFDLIFIVKDEHNENRDQVIYTFFIDLLILFFFCVKQIAKHVLNLHVSHRTDTADVGDIDIQKMRSYISFCRT
jgi:DNA replication licensing factor MCM5